MSGYVVQVSYPWHPNQPPREKDRTPETIEEAAQVFVDVAQPPATWTLAEIVEQLALEGRVEYQDPDSGRTVVARLAQVGAGV